MPNESPAISKPDAILIPSNYPPGYPADVTRHQALNRIFGLVFGTAKVATSPGMGQERSLVRPFNQDFQKRAGELTEKSLQFPQDHRLAMNERYDWYVARQDADGPWKVIGPVTGAANDLNEVWFGYAVDEESLLQQADRAADPEYERALAAQVNDPAVRARMERSGLLPKGATPQPKPVKTT